MAKFITQNNCQGCKRKVKLFESLSRDELAKINESHQEIQFNAGETIFKQGTTFTHLICVTSGLVKIYIEGPGRKNYLLRLGTPGELIGSPGMFTDNRHHFSVAAVEDTTTCFIDLKVFREILASNNTLALALISRSNSRDIEYFDKFISLTQKQVPGRVAEVILYLYSQVYKSNPFFLTISRQDMADMAAITKESLIRILKEFRDTGFISLEGNEMKILNEKALSNISENG